MFAPAERYWIERTTAKTLFFLFMLRPGPPFTLFFVHPMGERIEDHGQTAQQDQDVQPARKVKNHIQCGQRSQKEPGVWC